LSTSHSSLVNWLVTTADAGATYTSANTNITPGAPSASTFYTAACVSGFSTMARVFQPNSPQCHILYQWVLEGAANN